MVSLRDLGISIPDAKTNTRDVLPVCQDKFRSVGYELYTLYNKTKHTSVMYFIFLIVLQLTYHTKPMN